ncbi:MAG: hypothetical protein WKG07_20515 [Hymenobacter sp.]
MASLASGAAQPMRLFIRRSFTLLPTSAWPPRLRVLLGGLPGGLAGRFMATIAGLDKSAIEALGARWLVRAGRWWSRRGRWCCRSGPSLPSARPPTPRPRRVPRPFGGGGPGLGGAGRAGRGGAAAAHGARRR